MSVLIEYTPEEAQALLDNDSVFFADIRTEVEFNEAHVTGAINVPYKEEIFQQTVKKLMIPEKSFILISDDLLLVERATESMEELEYDMIGFLNWKKWKDEQFPIASLSEVEASQLNERLQKKKELILIDVRNPEEWTNGHIPSTRNIPLLELEKYISEFKPDQEIVTVCGIGGGRSAAAYSLLKKHGFHNTKLLKGGLQAWKYENLPTE